MGRIRLLCFSAVHFLVDFSCALLVLGRVAPDWDPALAVLLYNFFAFAVQMPLGLVADRFGRGELFASAGCLLVLAAWLLPPGMAAVIAGLGNASFHVGGGLDTLNASERDGRQVLWAGPLGIFVSTGAFGIYFGGLWAFSAPKLPVCMALLAAALLLAVLGKGVPNAPLSLPRGDGRFWGTAVCLVLVVILRSFLGLAADFSWKASYGLLSVAAAACGKAAGGLLADRFGVRRTAAVSLLLSTICFVWAGRAVTGLLGLFFFNMTMPLTLWAAARLLRGAKGFSFGLLTFGLFLGFLPVFFGASALSSEALLPTVLLPALSLVSLGLLLAGLRGVERRERDVS